MKTSAIVIIIVLFLAIIGTILFVHFRYEKPKSQSLALVDLSIVAKDGDKLIKTNYSIFVNGFYYSTGLTNTDDWVLARVPFNSSITIINSNLEGQTYYKNPTTFLTDKNETTRVILKLTSVGTLTIVSNTSDYKINTTVSSDGYFKDMKICLYWSVRIIFAEIENLTRIELIENNTKCYSGITLDNSDFNFIINYQTFGVINDDFININIYDFDEVYTKRQTYKNVNI